MNSQNLPPTQQIRYDRSPQRAGGQPGSSSRSSRAQRGQREHRIVPLLPPLRPFLIRDRADRLFFSKSNKKYHYLLIHTPPDWPRPIGAHMEGGRAALGCGTTARTGGLRHLRRRCLPAEAKKQKVGQRRNRGSRISKGTAVQNFVNFSIFKDPKFQGTVRERRARDDGREAADDGTGRRRSGRQRRGARNGKRRITQGRGGSG